MIFRIAFLNSFPDANRQRTVRVFAQGRLLAEFIVEPDTPEQGVNVSVPLDDPTGIADIRIAVS